MDMSSVSSYVLYMNTTRTLAEAIAGITAALSPKPLSGEDDFDAELRADSAVGISDVPAFREWLKGAL